MSKMFGRPCKVMVYNSATYKHDTEKDGVFIDLGLDTDNNMGSYTVAIVEVECELIMVQLHRLKFIRPYDRHDNI